MMNLCVVIDKHLEGAPRMTHVLFHQPNSTFRSSSVKVVIISFEGK